MKKLRNCPFCGQEVKLAYPDFGYISEPHNEWNLSHFCDPGMGLTVSVGVYGKTEAEVADRWNGGVDYGEVDIAD